MKTGDGRQATVDRRQATTSLDGMLESRCAELATCDAQVLQGRRDVQQLHDGQCGLCTHFGETHPQTEQITAIRTRHQAPEELLDDCGHPRHASLHLKVTPISGCDGFEAAPH